VGFELDVLCIEYFAVTVVDSIVIALTCMENLDGFGNQFS
jgi:hypothetical protein